MQEGRMLKDVEERLAKLNIYELRQVARAVGVKRPADGKKSRVTEDILSIAQGISSPEPPTLRGAPPKSQQFDERLVADIKRCREYFLLKNGGAVEESTLVVNDSAFESVNERIPCVGILQKQQNAYFLTDTNLRENGAFVQDIFIQRYCLREGDLVEGVGVKRYEGQTAGLKEIISVNGRSAENIQPRRSFANLTHIYPQTALKLDGEDAACRMINLFCPLAMGQRVVISAPPKSGKTTLIKSIGAGICRNYGDIKVIILLLNERPEVVTDFKRSLEAELFYTTFDMPGESSVATASLAFERAKRLTEEGENVVLIADGITALARAYGDLDKSVEQIKKLLYCACNAEEGGSLTVISTLSNNTANAAEGAIYNEFIYLADACIALSSALSLKRIFPAIDINACYAENESSFLTGEELSAATALRGGLIPAEEVVKLFKQTADNGEIVNRYKN